MAPALCLLVIAGPCVASRQRLLSGQPQKDTLALGPPYFLTLFMSWYRPAPSPTPTAAHDTDRGKMPIYTNPSRLAHFAAAAALLQWHIAVFQIWHM